MFPAVTTLAPELVEPVIGPVNIPDYSAWLTAFATNSDYYHVIVVFFLAMLLGVLMFHE